MLLLIQVLIVTQLPIDEPLLLCALLLPAYAACVSAQRYLPAPGLERPARYLFAAILGWLIAFVAFANGHPHSLAQALFLPYALAWPCLWLRWPRLPLAQDNPWLGIAVTALLSWLLSLDHHPYSPAWPWLVLVANLASLAQVRPGWLARALLLAALVSGLGPVAQEWMSEGCRPGSWIVSLGMAAGLLWPAVLSAKPAMRADGNNLDQLC